MSLQVISTERLLPQHSDTKSPRTIPLSITDAGCARFTPTGAIWVFDACPLEPQAALKHLKHKLCETLVSFPHFAGQLHWAPYEANGDHTKRFGRGMVTLGSGRDPGVEWTTARLERAAAEVVPGREGGPFGVWDDFKQPELMASTTPMALGDMQSFEGLPSVIVQVTLLKDKGIAIAVKTSHLLADATTLTLFVKHWAARSSATRLPPSPVFDPQALDARAAGDIDSPSPEADLVAQAHALPLHRYDWWATTAAGYPSFLAPSAEASKPTNAALLEAALATPVSIPSWNTWNILKPVSHTIFSFSTEQVEALRSVARREEPRASRLDAILAHMWSAVNRARGLGKDEEQVYLNLTLGLRARTEPALPETFLGSPLAIAHIKATGAQVSDPASIGRSAANIRACLARFTPQATSALLHAAAHEVAPSRLWQAFLGQRHLLVTSWLRLGVDEVDFFGDGMRPRYVHPIMPKMDGCVQVMDGRDGKGGIDVSVYLEAGAMVRLLDDSSLIPNHL